MRTTYQIGHNVYDQMWNQASFEVFVQVKHQTQNLIVMQLPNQLYCQVHYEK